jgi:hypothetical protein
MAGKLWQPHRGQRLPTLRQSRGRGLCTMDATVLKTKKQNKKKPALFRAVMFMKDYNEIRFIS